MTSPTSNGQAPYNWADDDEDLASNRLLQDPPPQRAPRQEAPRQSNRASQVAGAAGAAAGGFLGGLGSSISPPVNINLGGNGRGGNGGGGRSAGRSVPDGGERSNGDTIMGFIERVEFRGPKDIIACAKAVNLLGRELHFILSMRAEEIQAVLSTHKGTWYTFGASSRVKARLVAMHLKVSAEAAKALGVGALKMAHAFDRHFIKPEQEAKRKKSGKSNRREFSMEDV